MIRPQSLLLPLVLLPLAMPAPARAQDAGDNVIHDGESLRWSRLRGGVRFLSLYGNRNRDGQEFAFRLEMHPGFEARPHIHPVTEHMTVLSGVFFVGVGETMDKEAAKAYGPGSYIAIAPGVPAYMWVEEVTVVQIHGVGPFETVEVGAQDAGGR